MATTRLRLHRDGETEAPDQAGQIPATFRFPEIPKGRRGRVQSPRATLVAGRVDSDAADWASVGVPRADTDHSRPPTLRLMREDGTVTTPDLVRRVEHTLEAMQARLDRLRRQAEAPMRFPHPGDDDDRPTAA